MTANHFPDIADRLHDRLLRRCWPVRDELPPARWASALDRQADAQLQHGHVEAAERLSRQAAELREAAP